MKQIINKVAYWGRFTFKAYADIYDGKEVVRIDVYRNNTPSLLDNFYFIENKEQLLKMSLDLACSLQFYTDDLSYKQNIKKEVKRKNKNGKIITETVQVLVPAIDEFIKSFREIK